MSLSNASAASCMKFNSSFLYYIGFFVLLIVGYLWGRRTGVTEGKKKVERSESEKKPPSKKSKNSKNSKKSKK